MAPRKVIHIITRLDRGGSAQNTMLTVLGHDRTQFEPIVITGDSRMEDAQGGLRATADNLRRLEKEHIRYHVIPSLVRRVSARRDLVALWNLYRLLRRERPAIVHTHTSKAGVLGRLAAWWAAVPAVIHTPHGHVFYGHFDRLRSWLCLMIERLLARITSRLIALTGAERQEHLDRHVGTAERFAVIPSGIDVERFRRVRAGGKLVPDWFGCPPNSRIVGSVGWLTGIKGHRVLVEAVAILKQEFPTLHLVIAGSGDRREALIEQARQAGISHAVHLPGHREQVEDCLKGFDCFALPSLNEGMGRALIEAMAAGLPIVASRVGGIPAVVQDGVNGLLVPPGESRALAEALRSVLRDPQWARRLGEQAGRSIGEEYGIDRMVRAIETAYREAHG
ncbi:glycosyltransferase family 4 protein [Nitrospira moscoviensis]|uniref:Putative Glycosyl transferase, group 1 n=1 Tax=Nitrospira moscoviensis TaxID=42253 RepID=A0A0K2GB81_NITMO|nr:glycosyltransferase family 4 protein [Nitrospira moscoviensis]ALA58226.1 putative Glycosyl transferase, group 1 [Nitrospira moscoviensis]